MVTNKQLDFISYNLWLNEQGSSNSEELERVKKLLNKALQECVTDKQRTYLTLYFVNKLSVSEIASLCSVNSSTVSRVIHSGLHRLYTCLRFSSPIFINCSERKIHLRNKIKG